MVCDNGDNGDNEDNDNNRGLEKLQIIEGYIYNNTVQYVLYLDYTFPVQSG